MSEQVGALIQSSGALDASSARAYFGTALNRYIASDANGSISMVAHKTGVNQWVLGKYRKSSSRLTMPRFLRVCSTLQVSPLAVLTGV
jgi:hypothetical protein